MIIKGVLHNFLGTYTSRYSDFQGYWLFGMLVRDGLLELRMDLLNPNHGSSEQMSPVEATAVKLATEKFREQMERAGLSLSCVCEAHLNITRFSDLLKPPVYGQSRAGYNVWLLVRAVSARGTTCESEMTIFVAPHNSKFEICSK